MAVRSDPAYAYFLKRLVEARQTAGLTQAEVAARLGKPQSYISKCEVGEPPGEAKRLSWLMPPGNRAA